MWEEIVDFFTVGLVGLFSWFIGDRNGYINVLLTLIVVDYIMGVAVGYVRHELSSHKGFIGIAKKIFIICLVGVAHVFDEYIIGEPTFRTPLVLFYIANEGLSIIENADALNIPIPKFLRKRFLTMKKRGH
ncbi:MAG: phage holin family protein [Synergistaceae bacterium]|nr:phage holin family protein [Synergistaceae bacterium]